MPSHRWLNALCLAVLLSQGAAAGTPTSRAEATAFCQGVVWTAGQIVAMRPPRYMSSVEANLVIAMPDAQALALALAGDSDRRAGTLEPEAQAALRKSGGATLTRLLAEGGSQDPSYRALRDACRGLGSALHGTDPAALEAAFAEAVELVARYRE